MKHKLKVKYLVKCVGFFNMTSALFDVFPSDFISLKWTCSRPLDVFAKNNETLFRRVAAPGLRMPRAEHLPLRPVLLFVTLLQINNKSYSVKKKYF